MLSITYNSTKRRPLMIIFNLKEIMDDKDISINKLSTETGINRASLTSIANNESKMVQLATIESLLDYLKIDLSDLMLDVSDSAQIIFNFKQLSNFSFISETEFKFKNSSTKEIHILYLEKINSSYYKLTLDYLYNAIDVVDDHLLPKKTIDYYSDISFTDKSDVIYEAKDIFSSISNEKQQSIAGIIFDKCIERIFDPRYEITSDELTLFNEDIFSLDNIFFIDKVFSSELSGIYTPYEVTRKNFTDDIPYTPFFDGPTNHLEKPLNIGINDSKIITHIKFY